ncbi:glycoside hydrolase family 3 protein [Ferrimonas lipolytica]|uniref:beta-N-acetylhexosaminidase n=1 Tax=Ferrimonas lipolytica TaxID=2724191 RepID=A0A6H1UC40_9GAMM|nr:glycoside hydrolase family 3 protein [Ferrimonas lipolytica]QIZ75933.1 glycoside hydrolase family 3 protein [Ferrimonas lipolytica]
MTLIRQQLAQRLMIDLRHFSFDGVLKPVTQLDDNLKQLISSRGIGGVILFGENCQSAQQVRWLTDELQDASRAGALGLPLLLSIDQEGGRVVRTDRSWSTSLAGNMAIGATAAQHGDDYATAAASVIANELDALGINTVHAPCVDLNNNRDNPVINVRAFGETADLVSTLGLASCRAFASAGIAATLKHFPGHGDTATDSHTGLPLVAHSREHIERHELQPYRKIIAISPPPLVMTAHIQYPALDSSTVAGEIRPATMSRAIITGLLRDDIGYNGVVITDALDMAAIAKLMPPSQAVIEVFNAGVDIALMPLKIRDVSDFAKLDALLDRLEQALQQNELSLAEHQQSFKRIRSLKSTLKIEHSDLQTLACAEHRALELSLAQAAVTTVSGSRPEILDNSKRLLLLLPGKPLLQGLNQALAQLGGNEIEAVDISEEVVDWPERLARCDVVISGFVSPRQSAAELGGVDDLRLLDEQAVINAYQPNRLVVPLQLAQQMAKPVVYLSLRAPYDIALFGQYADWTLASYAYHVDSSEDPGASLTALAQAILGQFSPTGKLPVTVE